MSDKQIAADVLAAVGGKENVAGVTHCVTRLRFTLKDAGIPVTEEVKKIPGVIGVQESAGQYQVIIGQNVASVYAEVCALGGFASEDVLSERSADGGAPKVKKSIPNMIISTIVGSIGPIIPILIGTGLGKCILLIVQLLGIANAETSMTFYVFNFVFDAGFTFLPVFTAVSAAKHFGCNMFMAALMGCALLHPNWTSIVSSTDPKFIGDMFGIPLYGMSYGSTLVPAILIVWVMSKLEWFLNKHIPQFLRSMLVPLIVLLVMTPLSFLLLAPAMGMLAIVFGDALLWCYNTFGGIAIAVMCVVYPWLVVTGTHSTLAIAGIQILTQTGYDPFSRTLPLVVNMAQGAAALACALRTKSKTFRSTCLSSAFTVFFAGISEPTIYGVTLRLKRPMYAVMVGSGFGGVFAGFMGLKAYTFMTPSLVNIAMWIGGDGMYNLMVAVGAIVITVIATFIATLVIGFEDPVEEDAAAVEAPVA